MDLCRSDRAASDSPDPLEGDSDMRETRDMAQLGHVQRLEDENARLKNFAAKQQSRARAHEETIVKLEATYAACNVERKDIAQQLEQYIDYLGPLHKENDELKNRLLKLQSREVVSDAQINKKYEDLCNDIEEWVDTNLGDTEGLVSGVIAGIEKDRKYEQILLQYLDTDLWNSLKRHHTSELKFLACVVQRFILHQVVVQYAFGASEEVTEGLRIVEEQMKHTKHGEDMEQTELWRADTLHALLEAPSTAKSRARALLEVSQNAWRHLEPLFPRQVDQQKAMQSFHKRITAGAWEVHRQIRTSPANYRFERYHVAGTQTEVRPLSDGDRESNLLIDAETGSKVKRAKEIIFDQSQNIGRILCIIFPALVRVNAEGQKIRIGKATLLVEFNKRQLSSGPTMAGLVKRFTG